MKINHCPKCDSRLWGVESYSAPKKLFYLICSDCQYAEIKDGFIKSKSKLRNEF